MGSQAEIMRYLAQQKKNRLPEKPKAKPKAKAKDAGPSAQS